MEASVSISKKHLVSLKILHELNFNKIGLSMKINLIYVSKLYVLCDFFSFIFSF